MIEKLSDLKTNPVFSKLDQIQAKLDLADTDISKAWFTRSPYQLISFLITYAGLNAADRTYVVNRLPKDPEVSKEELDALIQNINWSALLLNPAGSALKFTLTIGTAKPEVFYECIKTNCPQLLEVLKNQNCLVKIAKEDRVIFTTDVNQDVKWAKAFTKEGNYWEVPRFHLSEALEQKIKNMASGEEWNSVDKGGFYIQKGDCEQIELFIKTPENDKEYQKTEKDLMVDEGIYKAFKDLTNFYGLERVDKVEVKLSNTATFSKTGATAYQKQEVSYIQECASMRVNNEDKKPTVVKVSGPLHVYYQGIDLMASLGQGVEKSADADSIQYHINLPVQEAQAGIRLYASKLTPTQMHDVNFDPTSSKALSADNTSSTSVSNNNKVDHQFSGSSSSSSSSSSDKKLNPNPNTKTNYNFLFKLGMALTAAVTVAAIIVAALALSSIIPMASGGIIGMGVVAAAGLISTLTLAGLYSKSGPEKVSRKEVSESASMDSAIAPGVR